MNNKHNTHNNGASRSNTHHSWDQSLNQGRQAFASFPCDRHYLVDEGAIGLSLEDHVSKIEESQNKIIQLLREAHQLLVKHERIHLPQDRSLVMDGPSCHQVKVTLC